MNCICVNPLQLFQRAARGVPAHAVDLDAFAVCDAVRSGLTMILAARPSHLAGLHTGERGASNTPMLSKR